MSPNDVSSPAESGPVIPPSVPTIDGIRVQMPIVEEEITI